VRELLQSCCEVVTKLVRIAETAHIQSKCSLRELHTSPRVHQGASGALGDNRKEVGPMDLPTQIGVLLVLVALVLLASKA
jgi:hypothetical protein